MILVTGGAGFIGSAFVRIVDNPVVYDALTYSGRLENLQGVPHTFIKGDIRDKEKLEKVVNDYGIDIIVNFAAESHVDRSISDPGTFLVNVEGVVNLLNICRKYGIRLVHISTDEVYGERENATEDSPLNPSSPYAASKAAGDLFIKAYVRTYGVDAIIIRPSNNYGPRQYPEKFIPKTIIRTLLGLEVPIYGDGSQVRDWIYVEDTVRLIKDLMKNGKSGEIYNLPGNNHITNLELVKLIGKIMNKEVKIKFVKDRPGHDRLYSMKSKLKYEVTPLEEGLRKTIEWYINNEWWWRGLINDRYFKLDEPW